MEEELTLKGTLVKAQMNKAGYSRALWFRVGNAGEEGWSIVASGAIDKWIEELTAVKSWWDSQSNKHGVFGTEHT